MAAGEHKEKELRMGTRKVGQVSFRILELPNLNDEYIVNHCLDFPPLGQSIHLTILQVNGSISLPGH